MGKKREKKIVRMKDGTEPKHSNGKEHNDNGKEIAGERTTTRERKNNHDAQEYVWTESRSNEKSTTKHCSIT